jgi:hypothetical protein
MGLVFSLLRNWQMLKSDDQGNYVGATFLTLSAFLMLPWSSSYQQLALRFASPACTLSTTVIPSATLNTLASRFTFVRFLQYVGRVTFHGCVEASNKP